MALREETAFGNWLRRRRKALDFTQEAPAKCVGCSAITIRKVEAGDYRLSRQMAQRLASCLGIPPDQHEAVAGFARSGRWSGDLDPRRDLPGLNNLPLPPTTLIGQERALAAVRDLLMSSRVPVLTLVGPPGVGKTRLAVEVAIELAGEFQNGVFFVPLASPGDARLVPATIAQTLEIGGPAGQSPVARLHNYLRNKQLLLLLDNFEHLMEGSQLVAELVARSPFLKVLVTSREPPPVSSSSRLRRCLILPSLERAAKLLGAARAMHEPTGVVMSRADSNRTESTLASVQAQLSSEVSRIAWEDGRAMSIEQVIEYALEES